MFSPYAYRARTKSCRFTHKNGEHVSVTPTGPFSVTNIDALLSTLLDGIGIAEVPSFVGVCFRCESPRAMSRSKLQSRKISRAKADVRASNYSCLSKADTVAIVGQSGLNTIV